MDGKELNELLKSKNLTQADLARVLDTNRMKVSRWCKSDALAVTEVAQVEWALLKMQRDNASALSWAINGVVLAQWRDPDQENEPAPDPGEAARWIITRWEEWAKGPNAASEHRLAQELIARLELDDSHNDAVTSARIALDVTEVALDAIGLSMPLLQRAKEARERNELVLSQRPIADIFGPQLDPDSMDIDAHIQMLEKWADELAAHQHLGESLHDPMTHSASRMLENQERALRRRVEVWRGLNMKTTPAKAKAVNETVRQTRAKAQAIWDRLADGAWRQRVQEVHARGGLLTPSLSSVVAKMTKEALELDAKAFEFEQAMLEKTA